MFGIIGILVLSYLKCSEIWTITPISLRVLINPNVRMQENLFKFEQNNVHMEETEQ